MSSSAAGLVPASFAAAPEEHGEPRAIMIAAAIVAANELMRMSRCFTCASRGRSAISSSGPSARRMPSVAATAACCGLRPVANALGELSG